ncbi:MAG: acyl-CoA/acyl-ACP dehydrogenase [bacterium]|nr:acyl-CoA/acyl-ACP dehydrogenase [bacterium]
MTRAEWFASESAAWICARAVQHSGGLGVKRGQIVDRPYCEACAQHIHEGASEVKNPCAPGI